MGERDGSMELTLPLSICGVEPPIIEELTDAIEVGLESVLGASLSGKNEASRIRSTVYEIMPCDGSNAPPGRLGLSSVSLTNVPWAPAAAGCGV